MQEIILFLKDNSLESIAVIFSLIYVFLAAKKNIYCWFAAIISVCLYIYICYNTKLYAETGLQIFYLLMAFYGYYNWKQEKSESMLSWSIDTHLLYITIGLIITFFIGYYLTIYTNASSPIIDAFTSVFAIIGTYMITKKVIENWLYWIVIDIVSIHLYYSKDLYLSSILFIIYTFMAIYGYITWLKKIKYEI